VHAWPGGLPVAVSGRKLPPETKLAVESMSACTRRLRPAEGEAV